MEPRVEAHRDSKVAIYIQAVLGIVCLSVCATTGIHIATHHNVTAMDYITLVVSLCVGLYLCYRSYQQFQEKFHNFALAIAKK